MPDTINVPVRDVKCSAIDDNATLYVGGATFYVGGDVYIGAANNYKPIKNYIIVDVDGLFRLQREINETIERLARNGRK